MAVKCLALELRPRGVTAVVLHRGWVQTEMGGPTACLQVPETVRSMVRVIARQTERESGQFIC